MSDLNPNISFQVLETKDPDTLMVADTSNWGAIVGKESIIEISTPNSSKVKTFYFDKGKINIFNSSLLGTSTEGIICALPDGVYTIKVIGSPDSFYECKDYLKNDSTKLKLYKELCALGSDCDEISDEKRDEIVQQFLNVEISEACAATGDMKGAAETLKKVNEDLTKMDECKDCKTC